MRALLLLVSVASLLQMGCGHYRHRHCGDSCGAKKERCGCDCKKSDSCELKDDKKEEKKEEKK